MELGGLYKDGFFIYWVGVMGKNFDFEVVK